MQGYCLTFTLVIALVRGLSSECLAQIEAVKPPTSSQHYGDRSRISRAAANRVAGRVLGALYGCAIRSRGPPHDGDAWQVSDSAHHRT
jgi:hypothetical protein